MPQSFLETLRGLLPPIFARSRLTELTGGLINSRTIANLHCLKKGPPFIKLGNKVVMELEPFLAWVAEYYSKKNTGLVSH